MHANGVLINYDIHYFFKQKTAYEVVSRDGSSDVCSSDLVKVIEPAIHWKHERFSKLIISKAILKPNSSTWRSFYEDWGLTDQDLNFILKLVDADEESNQVRNKTVINYNKSHGF